MKTKTFVIGGKKADAIKWCKANGIKPYAKSTRIMTTELSTRGQVIGLEDKVIWFGPVNDELKKAVAICLR